MPVDTLESNVPWFFAVLAPNPYVTAPSTGHALRLRPAASNVLRIAVETYTVHPEENQL